MGVRSYPMSSASFALVKRLWLPRSVSSPCVSVYCHENPLWGFTFIGLWNGLALLLNVSARVRPFLFVRSSLPPVAVDQVRGFRVKTKLTLVLTIEFEPCDLRECVVLTCSSDIGKQSVQKCGITP